MKTVTVQETTYQVQAAITIQETMETVHTIQEIIQRILAIMKIQYRKFIKINYFHFRFLLIQLLH